MITFISVCVLFLIVVVPPSLCRPQETTDAEPKDLPVYTTYEDYIYDYGATKGTYSNYGFLDDYEGVDYGKIDYGDYGYDYYESTEHYVDYGHYGDYFGYGDRNNPVDTGLAVAGMNGIMPPYFQMPWVYIIVPVVEVDVFYLDAKDKELEDVELKLPVDTYFFEFGEFGMGHFDLGDFGFGRAREEEADYSSEEVYYPQNDYPQYDVMAEHYDTADDLDNYNIMDYPGIDHDNSWVDWIFMVPPGQIIR